MLEDRAASRVLGSLERARKECIALLADAAASDRAKARAKETAKQCEAIIKQASKGGGKALGEEMLGAGKKGLRMTWKGMGVWEPNLAGELSSFNLIPVRAMEVFDRVVLPKWTNLTGDAANAVAYAIETGLARGESYSKLVKRVLGEHGTGSIYTTQYRAANLLVRQSVNEAVTLTAQEGIAEAARYNPGIRQMWIARLVRSTPICAGLHGQVVDVDKPFKWNDWEGMAPPAIGSGADPKYHICHSTVVAHHPDWEIDVKPLTPGQIKQATDKKGAGLDLDGRPPGGGGGSIGSSGGGGRGPDRGNGGPNGEGPVSTHVKKPDGAIVPATVDRFQAADLEAFNAWFADGLPSPRLFTWLSPSTLQSLSRQGVRLMKLEAESGLQGLVTLSNSIGIDGAAELYIGKVESAPWNMESYPERRFKSTFAAILEAAVQESVALGFDGRIGLIASEPHLVTLYRRYGFKVVVPEVNAMELGQEAAEKFLRDMEEERGRR